jgi:hypothetical protein
MKDRRKLSRKLLQHLPEPLRLELMRKSVRINPAWPSPSLEIKIANSEPELQSAYRLLHDAYVQAGFMNPDPTGMRVLPQHLLPQTTTIVAKWDGHVIGTLSLIRDNPFGLPLEKIFDVSDRRAQGRRLAEVSSLAVDPKYRGQINHALFPLFRFVFQYARDYFGIHEFVIAVNPSMVDLYLGFICFEKLKGKPRAYDFVKGAPAVGLYLNFESAAERWKTVFGERPDANNFHKYWLEKPTDPRNQLPQRQYRSAFDAVLTPKLLTEFFLGRARLEERLSYKDLHILLEAYPFPDFQKVLRPLQESKMRRSVRMETQMHAKIANDTAEAEVLNVSREGFLLRTSTPSSLKNGDQIQVMVWLNESSPTVLTAKVQVRTESCLVGCEIAEASNEWLQMIEALENDYRNRSSGIRVVA